MARLKLLLLFILLGVTPTVSAKAANLPSYVYDYADILTSSMETELTDSAKAYSDELGVHFVILTLDDSNVTDLETYTRNFFEENVAGVGGIYECAVMTVNMGTRRVASDYFGELRTMISEVEADVIREGYTPDLTNGDYLAAARYFLDESAAMIENKFAYYRLEAPAVDHDEMVYDFGGVLSAEELNNLKQSARDLSAKTGVAHIIAILDDWENGDYLGRFASSFYKQNFMDESAYGGAFVLAVSAGSKQAAVSPFGSYMPVNSLIWTMQSDMDYKLRYNSLYESCMYFLDSQADQWQADNLVLPEIDPEQKVYDYMGALTDRQKSDLQALIAENREKYGVDLMVVLSEYDTERTLSAFKNMFNEAVYNYHRDNTDGNYVILYVGKSPAMLYDWQYISVNFGGSKVYKKIGYNQENKIWSQVYSETVINGDYYAASLAFVNETAKALGSFVPNIRMIDDMGWVLKIGALMALVLSAVVLLILRIAHGFGLKREMSAANYLVGDSLQLHYIKDVFLHSHTSQTARSDDSSSGGGGSSGSSGGGTSTHSEGGF